MSKLIYHGSPNQFTLFDYSRIGSAVGTTHGFGFYFTDSADLARSYARNGYVYTAEFLGRKALSAKRKTLSVSNLALLIRSLPSPGDFLSNYGEVEYEGASRVLYRAVMSLMEAKSDVDIIGDMINSFGSKEIVLRTLNRIFGYDHIKQRVVNNNTYIYVMLVPEAFRVLSVRQVSSSTLQNL